MENQEQNQDQPQEQPKVVSVDVRFLQDLTNYLITKPYNEVSHFVDVLTGKNIPVDTTSEE